MTGEKPHSLLHRHHPAHALGRAGVEGVMSLSPPCPFPQKVLHMGLFSRGVNKFTKSFPFLWVIDFSCPPNCPYLSCIAFIYREVCNPFIYWRMERSTTSWEALGEGGCAAHIPAGALPLPASLWL